MHIVAKTGMTTMKTILLRIVSNGRFGYYSNIKNIHISEHLALYFKTERLKKKGILDKLAGFTLLVVVRHPLARLVSAYYNKVMDRSKNNRYRKSPAKVHAIH